MKNRILYLAFLSIFIIIAIEVSIRLLHLAPQIGQADLNYVKDPYLPFKQKPLSIVSGRSRTNEYNYVYKHNSLGFRDVEHTIKKPEGVFRILGLGDSFTYGQGASFEETYLYRLEKMLNERRGSHPRVEIIKAGMRRYFPEIERMFLEYYGLKYQPDLILIGFVPNDVIDTFLGLEAIELDEKGGFLKSNLTVMYGKPITWLYMNSHLFRIILQKYLISRKKSYKFNEVYKPNGFHEKDWREVEFQFKKIIEIAKKPVVIIHIPQDNLDDKNASYPAERLSNFCKKNRCYFIDTLPAMRKASKTQTLYWEGDGHCNGAGYKVIAETVYLKLLENKLIP